MVRKRSWGEEKEVLLDKNFTSDIVAAVLSLTSDNDDMDWEKFEKHSKLDSGKAARAAWTRVKQAMKSRQKDHPSIRKNPTKGQLIHMTVGLASFRGNPEIDKETFRRSGGFDTINTSNTHWKNLRAALRELCLEIEDAVSDTEAAMNDFTMQIAVHVGRHPRLRVVKGLVKGALVSRSIYFKEALTDDIRIVHLPNYSIDQFQAYTAIAFPSRANAASGVAGTLTSSSDQQWEQLVEVYMTATELKDDTSSNMIIDEIRKRLVSSSPTPACFDLVYKDPNDSIDTSKLCELFVAHIVQNWTHQQVAALSANSPGGFLLAIAVGLAQRQSRHRELQVQDFKEEPKDKYYLKTEPKD